MTLARRVAVVTLLIAGLVAMAALLGAGQASAHTDLADTDPAVDSRSDQAVTAVRLTFNDSVLPDLTEIVVRDENGKDHAAGRPGVLGPEVSVPVDGLDEAGTYTVDYRVVAADGHPIFGEYTFDVTPGAAEAAAAAGNSGASGIASAGLTSGGSSPWLVPTLGSLAAAALVLARFRVAVRRRTS
jgi:copper resistance protein C